MNPNFSTQHERLVCLDIETVPDRNLIPDWADGKFPPKPVHHRVVAISFVEARIERGENLAETYLVTCCQSGGQADWDEQRLLEKYWQYFAESAPRVVTWNGKGFDLPVLRARAMITASRLTAGISAARSGTAIRSGSHPTGIATSWSSCRTTRRAPR
jgi:predicted PolB exonuclease-like 3'-5' exonuclease